VAGPASSKYRVEEQASYPAQASQTHNKSGEWLQSHRGVQRQQQWLRTPSYWDMDHVMNPNQAVFSTSKTETRYRKSSQPYLCRQSFSLGVITCSSRNISTCLRMNGLNMVLPALRHGKRVLGRRSTFVSSSHIPSALVTSRRRAFKRSWSNQSIKSHLKFSVKKA